MSRILFSLPVHERPDIVRNQIDNIKYFCPDALICLHISEGAAEERSEFLRQCDVENVLINPHSYPTQWSAGIMHTHISNFLYVIEANWDFDKIVLISSNELLVKHGLEDYVARFEIGSQMEVYDSSNDWGVFREDFLKSGSMQGYLSALGLPLFFGGQAEGQFASKALFLQIAKAFVANFPMGPIGFPIEEVILPTMAARSGLIGVTVGMPITLCNYCNNLQITPQVVDQVRSARGALFARRVPRALRSPHIGASVLDSVFSVKRVPREDCELRRYIVSLMV
ncbi:hypothetical protein [Pseudorhizobium flavum]|uniref:Uncharacterized protein n=1 Tax=Pseudorhizobium flavum TaxID=1335061 RepID=A0A7W9Z2T7_9HYPH|nr:hypothetical protein [Pseudorhizobium flavum]MBB6182131.1 hypothetical protein [Pseudorhizobium flavum]CAD6632294.1 hypothetical protein RFYW14_04644 [Pseudorhizobium flavum]